MRVVMEPNIATTCVNHTCAQIDPGGGRQADQSGASKTDCSSTQIFSISHY